MSNSFVMKRLPLFFICVCILILNSACKKDKTNPTLLSDCVLTQIHEGNYMVQYTYKDSLIQRIDDYYSGFDTSESLRFQYNASRELSEVFNRDYKYDLGKGFNLEFIMTIDKGRITKYNWWSQIDGQARVYTMTTHLSYNSAVNITQLIYTDSTDTLGMIEVIYNKPGNIQSLVVSEYKSNTFSPYEQFRLQTNGKPMASAYLPAKIMKDIFGNFEDVYLLLRQPGMEEIEKIYYDEKVAGEWKLKTELSIPLTYNSNGKLNTLTFDNLRFTYNWNCK